jgi:hypothetical protein
VNLAAVLAGSWSVERHVSDLRSGLRGQFAGTAWFEPEDGRVRWAERGRLRFGARETEVRRELAIVDGPGGWTVVFEDGRPFHPLDLATGACTVEHLCGSDRYAGEYRLLGPDVLEIVWQVSGPGKRQEIRSTYRRDGSGDPLS